MRYVYETQGTCSRKINIELDDNNKILNVKFEGGCNGNTQGIAKLVKGLDAFEVVSKLRGIRCGFKPTSCPDQLATALEQILAKN